MATNSSANIVTAATGKVLQGAGVGTANAFSTATYPSTATGTGKILRADGTNWAASTAVYPDTAGSSGNILTSDGTNWVSSAPGAGGGGAIFTCIGIALASPADSTTYYILNAGAPSTTIGTNSRFWIPRAGTITGCAGAISNTGTLGTGESATIAIRLNDTSNTNVTTSLATNTTLNTFSNTGLSTAVAAGDFISFMFITPAWATNPTNLLFSLSVAIS